MRYKPLFADIETLLWNLGYEHAENRGYELPYKIDTRFHVLTFPDKTIELHYDFPHPTRVGKHSSSKFGKHVREEMKRIQKYDFASASFWVLLKYRLLKWF